MMIFFLQKAGEKFKLAKRFLKRESPTLRLLALWALQTVLSFILIEIFENSTIF